MLQPKERSFGKYILLGYTYSRGKSLNGEQKKVIEKISEIDDSILIKDDIEDGSEFRNGIKTFHKKIGIKKALAKAKNLEEVSRKSLINLTLKLGANSKKALKVFDKFLKDVEKGQRIDKENSKYKKYSKNLEKRYFKMIKLFTGRHIRYGLEIGQILSKKKPDKTIGKIAEEIGIVRQILDDYEDYLKAHHEPFGDIINNSNRFPEIIFMKNGGNKKEVISLIKDGKIKEAKNKIFSEKNKKEIFKECDNRLKKLNLKKLKKIGLEIPNYKKILK